MFGTPFRRSAVLLAALPMALATAPAASAAAPSCETVLVNTLGVRVALGAAASNRLNVCVTDVTAGGLIVSVNVAAQPGTLPTVTRTTGLCPAGAVLTGPVEVSFAVRGDAVCVSLNGLATTVTLGDVGYDPGVQVWRAGTGGLIDVAFCLEEYVEYTTQPWAPDNWTPCGYTPHRIL
jgi:hypothetical protein